MGANASSVIPIPIKPNHRVPNHRIPNHRIGASLENKLDSDKFTPVRIHAGNRSLLGILEYFPDSVELDLHETVQVPVDAEGRDPFACRENVGGPAAARGQPRVLARSETQLLISRRQLDRPHAVAADEIAARRHPARSFFAGY